MVPNPGPWSLKRRVCRLLTTIGGLFGSTTTAGLLMGQSFSDTIFTSVWKQRARGIVEGEMLDAPGMAGSQALGGEEQTAGIVMGERLSLVGLV